MDTFSGEKVEGAVASVFWDLCDAENGDEEYSTITPGTALQNFGWVWNALGSSSHPANAAEFYNALQEQRQTAAPTDIGTRNRIRGIFERNGIILSRAGIDRIDTATITDELREAALYQGQEIEIYPRGTVPVSATPVESKEWRLQALSDSLPGTDSPTEWGFINGRLYDETRWRPNNAATGFEGTTLGFLPDLDVDFNQLFGVPTNYPGMIGIEGNRYALRVQDKDEYDARDSFQPEYQSDLYMLNGTAQWLNDPQFGLTTLKRVVVDNYRPLVCDVRMTDSEAQRYNAGWEYGIGTWFGWRSHPNRIVAPGEIGLAVDFSEPVDSATIRIDGLDADPVPVRAGVGNLTDSRLVEFPWNRPDLWGLRTMSVAALDRAGNGLAPFFNPHPSGYLLADDVNGHELSRDVTLFGGGEMAGTGDTDTVHRFLVAALICDSLAMSATGETIIAGPVELRTVGIDTEQTRMTLIIRSGGEETVTVFNEKPFRTVWDSRRDIHTGQPAYINAQANFPDGGAETIRAAVTHMGEEYGLLPVYAQWLGDTVVFDGDPGVATRLHPDNFRPYVESVKLVNNGFDRYAGSWELDGNLLNDSTMTRFVGPGSCQVTVRFSEAVETATLQVRGFDNLPVKMTAGTNPRVWTRNFGIPSTLTPVQYGTRLMAIAAQDLAGNELVPFWDPGDTVIDLMTDSGILGSGFARDSITLAPVGPGDTDTLHRFPLAYLNLNRVLDPTHYAVYDTVILQAAGLDTVGYTVWYTVDGELADTGYYCDTPSYWAFWNSRINGGETGMARCNAEARYPDGYGCTVLNQVKYHGLEVGELPVCANITGTGDTQTFASLSAGTSKMVIPDNFRPWVEAVTVRDTEGELYWGAWETDTAVSTATTLALELPRWLDRYSRWVNKESDSLTITILFSEMMDTSTVAVKVQGATVTPLGETPRGEQMLWTGNILVSALTSTGNEGTPIEIAGKDRTGSELLQLSSPASDANALTFNASLLTRNPGSGVFLGAGGRDTAHKLAIDREGPRC